MVESRVFVTGSVPGPPQGGRIRAWLRSLAGLPRALKLVWETSPALTVLLGVATLGEAAIPAATAWAGKLVVDGLLKGLSSPGLGWSGIAPGLIFSASLALASLMLGTVSQGTQDTLRERLTYRVNNLILRKSLTMDLEFFETPAKQDMLQRATAEAGFRPVQVLQSTFSLIRGTITLVSIAALLVRFSVWVLLLLVVTGLPALYVQTRFSRESFALYSGRAPLWRKLMYYSMLLTQNWHVKEVKLFGLGKHLYGRYEEMSKRFARENTSLALRRNGASAGLRLLGLIGYYGAYVAVIAQALRGRLTIGDVTLYSGLLMQAPMIAGSLMYTMAGLYESNLFLGNLFAFLSAEPRIRPGDGTGLAVPATLKQGVVFENVSFRYPGAGEDVLRDVSLAIRPGEKVAIVGENGAGKTTLIKLLTRLYEPTQGRITLEGHDLRDYEPESLHARVGVIFQDFVRYNLTARENIGFGQIDALDDLERIKAAASKSGADAMIQGLERGYEATLGRWFVEPGEKAGVDLSLGQWQKVALARAFMRDAPILVLDEPTASLDARAEYEVFLRFRELTADRAAILISHRFSTVRMADRIVVLESGRIVEQGTHEELMRAAGHYAALFNLQAQGYR